MVQQKNPYLRLGYGAWLIALYLFLLPSCTDSESWLPDAPEENERCEVTLRLDVSSFSGQGNADSRASVAGNTDEDRIHDIWVFQYNATSGEKLKEPVYLYDVADYNNIEVNLAYNTEGVQSLVCIVANTGDKDWALQNGLAKDGFNTYESFLQQTLPSEASQPFLSSNMGETGGKTIPMFGVSKAMTIASKCYVRVPLTRMFARLDIKVTYPYGNIKLEKLTVSNIPAYCRVGTLATENNDIPAEYPTDIKWVTYDAEKATEIFLYVPENLQGKVADLTQKAGDQISTYALAVTAQMATTGTDETAGEAIATTDYTVYPGLNTTNDFNIKRNYIYKVNININNN